MSLRSVEIISPGGATRAVFVPEAGMVCRSLTHRVQELLHEGRGLDAYAQRGKTMGIPLLYPWANRLSAHDYEAAGRRVQLPRVGGAIPQDPNGLPIHGVLPGLMRWEAESQDERLMAQLRWEQAPLLDLFPYRHEVRMQAAVSEGELMISTIVCADAGDPVPVSLGYHPYLRLPCQPRASCRMELPGCERLLTDERSIPTGEREPLGPQVAGLGGCSWDDGLVLHGLPARFCAGGTKGAHGGAMIVLELQAGFPFGQVYAPPEADFVCFEPMSAPTNALRSGSDLIVLAPGQEHRATFRINVSPGT
ncbi:MAG: aldose 1-epimerase [Actinomycetota bacterium]|nr:aldose 1-epimerase [Actinomycetota bacterium]